MFIFTVISFLSLAATQPSPPAVDRSSLVSTAKAFMPNPEAKLSVKTQQDRYAIVLYRDGNVEGRVVNGQILLQKFAFGWQVIDLADASPGFTSAKLYNHGISTDAARALLSGVVSGALPSGEWSYADYGPSDDVNAIRQTAEPTTGEAIASVKIYGGFAILAWFGRGGGERVFAKRNGHWVGITGGGGCLDEPGLVHYGVSSDAAARFAKWFPCGPFPITSPASTK